MSIVLTIFSWQKAPTITQSNPQAISSERRNTQLDGSLDTTNRTREKRNGYLICGDIGHVKVTYPNRKKCDKNRKEVVSTVYKEIIVESHG